MTSRVRHGRMFALAAASAAQHQPAAGQCELQWLRTRGRIDEPNWSCSRTARLTEEATECYRSEQRQSSAVRASLLLLHLQICRYVAQCPSPAHLKRHRLFPLTARPSLRCLLPLACSRWRTSKRQAAHRSVLAVTGRCALRAGPITASPSTRLHHVGASCSSASCSTDELMLVPTSIRRLPALQWRRRDMEEARRVAARWRARPRAHVLVFPLESAAFSGALSQRTDRAGLAHSKMVPAGVGLPAYRNGAECTELQLGT